MTTKTKSASEELASLDERLADAQRAVTKVDQEQSAAYHRVREIEAEIERALGADEPTKKLDAQYAESKRKRDETPWTARRQAASDKLRKMTAERGAFLFENVEEIVAERAPEAQAIPEDIKALLSQSLKRLEDWHHESNEYGALFRDVSGIDGTDVPHMPPDHEALMRDIRRVLSTELPAPLPMSVGPGAREIPPKTKTAHGFMPTMVSTGSGEVIAQ